MLCGHFVNINLYHNILISARSAGGFQRVSQPPARLYLSSGIGRGRPLVTAVLAVRQGGHGAHFLKSGLGIALHVLAGGKVVAAENLP